MFKGMLPEEGTQLPVVESDKDLPVVQKEKLPAEIIPVVEEKSDLQKQLDALEAEMDRCPQCNIGSCREHPDAWQELLAKVNGIQKEIAM